MKSQKSESNQIETKNSTQENIFTPKRLKEFDYMGSYCYSLTICTYNRTHFFKAEKIVRFVESILVETSKNFQFDIICYCFMPDHLHCIVQGKDDKSDLHKFIKNFKQITGYRFKQKANKQLWQTSYYDHVIRHDENLYNASKYIIENPLRKGLVKDSRDYPYSWCKYFDVRIGDAYL